MILPLFNGFLLIRSGHAHRQNKHKHAESRANPCHAVQMRGGDIFAEERRQQAGRKDRPDKAGRHEQAGGDARLRLLHIIVQRRLHAQIVKAVGNPQDAQHKENRHNARLIPNQQQEQTSRNDGKRSEQKRRPGTASVDPAATSGVTMTLNPAIDSMTSPACCASIIWTR